MAEQQQDVDALKRRARRRLVGAVALVLAAVIVLPMVFDSEPRSPAPPVSVRIPGEDDTPFAPKMPAKPPAKAPARAEAPKAESRKAETPKPLAARLPEKELPKIKPAPKAPSAAERARAEAALAGAGPQFFVPVGAFANPESVIAKLSAAKIPYYTEDLAIASGKVTRVRAGPYASKDAAEKTAERLKGLGFKPGNVAAKAG